MPAREKIAQRVEVAERLRHLLAFDDQMLGMQPRAHERFSRWRLRSARFRFRGAGMRGPRRRCGYPAYRRDISWPWPSIRCASRGGRDRCAFPRNARRASAPSTARNRARRPFRTDRRPRARRPACRRRRFSRAFRRPETSRCGNRSSLRCCRSGLFPAASRSARPCLRCDRSRGPAPRASGYAARRCPPGNAWMYFSVYSRMPIPAAAADWMMRSSTSVTFITCSTRRPCEMQESPQHVLKHERAEVSDVRGGVNRRPAGVDAHFCPGERGRAAAGRSSACCAGVSGSYLCHDAKR